MGRRCLSPQTRKWSRHSCFYVWTHCTREEFILGDATRGSAPLTIEFVLGKFRTTATYPTPRAWNGSRPLWKMFHHMELPVGVT